MFHPRLGIVALLLFCACTALPAEVDLRTKAEQTDFQATSTYEDVMALCHALAERSTSVTLVDYGQSVEGRKLPLLVLSETKIRSPAEIKNSVKPVILCTANIHGGEVCGKEALLILTRELTETKDHPLLRDFVLLFAPILNPDGNERFSSTNRLEQNGPPQSGQRANAAGLDLNRDFTKLGTPEVQALVRLIQQWDPAIVIDTHATDGSYHRYALTYDGPRHPASHPALIDFVQSTFLPDVSQRLKARSGYDSFFYGDFDESHDRWETFPALPRYGTHYIGLRDRIALLAESYSHAPFKERVLVTKEFVRHSIETAAQRKKEIIDLLADARKESARPGLPLAVRSQLAPENEPVTIKGFVEKPVRGRELPTQPLDYKVQSWRANKVSRQVKTPYAYLIPRSVGTVVTNLQRHGIEVQELREDVDLEVETYLVTARHQEGTVQKQRRSSFEARPTNVVQSIRAGTYVVRTGQKLGRLAAYLLEPEATDGLAAWDACGIKIETGDLFPISRVTTEIPLLTIATRPLPQDRSFHRQLDFATYSQRLNFSGNPTAIDSWLDDAHFLQVRGGTLMKVEALTGSAVAFFSTNDLIKALSAIPDFKGETARQISRRTRFDMNPDRTGAFFESNDDLYFFRFDGSNAVRLTRTPGREELASFSPDGQWLAFVRGDNLFSVNLATQKEHALTSDGGGDIRNGKADWVYFEEIYNRRWRAYWWSPDSRRIAFHRFDASALPLFQALNTIPLHGRVEAMRHPKPGDPNPEVKLGVTSVEGGDIDWVNLENYPPGSYLISRVGWLPDNQAIYFYVQNRIQTWLDFNTWTPGRARFQRRFRETSPAWVDEPGPVHFLPRGDILFASERDGWRHLYRFDIREQSWHALTSGPWEVRQIHQLDETNGWIYFTATRDQLIAEDLYRCRLDGTDLHRLTARAGFHRVSLNPTATMFVDAHSDYSTPEKVRLHSVAKARTRMLDSNPVYLWEEFNLGTTELRKILTRDGFEMEASIVRPPGFSAQAEYPVWLTTYAGPKAPVVQNQWSRSRVYDQMLAQMGLIVLRLDPRSASGKGAVHAWKAYRQLGVQELEDITDGIEWMKKKPYVDATRIGMGGFSYGGFMTAYALTHSRLFAAGIAGAAVTDWAFYDSIYTERYMDLPRNNPEGYRKSSVVAAASDLHGRLLILHGMMDDNVHLQNSVVLMDALQKANKPFEVMFYPEMKHGVSGAHYDRLTLDFIRRTMRLETNSPPIVLPPPSSHLSTN